MALRRYTHVGFTNSELQKFVAGAAILSVAGNAMSLDVDVPVGTEADMDAFADQRGFALLSATPTGQPGRASALIAFTNGDPVQRVTVTDAAVTPANRPGRFWAENLVTEDQDLQLAYTVTVVSVVAGSFVVNVTAQDADGDDLIGLPLPTVNLFYTLG